MLTRVVKEAIQIDLKDAVVIFLKSDLANEGLIDIFGRLSHKGSEMNSAKVDKIKGRATEDKYRLSVKFICGVSDIADNTALIGQLELRKSAEFIVNGGGIGKHIGFIFYITQGAKIFLFFFGLNG